MILTDKEIQEDIEAFQDRIHQAREKLSRLPVGPLSHQKHKVREKATRDLLADIKHYEQVIGYAREGLSS